MVKFYKLIFAVIFLFISSTSFAFDTPDHGGPGTSLPQITGGLASNGSVVITELNKPVAPSIVSGFTSGTTDYYFCVDGDVNTGLGLTSGEGLTLASTSTGTTGTTGTMTCAGQAGALEHYLLRYTASSLVGFGVQAVLVGSCTVASGASCNISDANNTLTNIYVQNGNATGFVVGNSYVSTPDSGVDGFFVNNKTGSTGNAFTCEYNTVGVGAINAQCGAQFPNLPQIETHLSSTVPVDVSNTTTETVIATGPVNGNFLGINGCTSFTIHGDMLYNNVNTDTFTLRLRNGTDATGTVMASASGSGVTTSASRRALYATIQFCNAHARNAQNGNGSIWYVSGMFGGAETTGLTIDTTTTQNYTLTWQWGAASSNDDVKFYGLNMITFP